MADGDRSPTPKVAWGGAGMVQSSSLSSKKGLPSHKSRDNSNFSSIQSEDLAKEIDHQEIMKTYTKNAFENVEANGCSSSATDQHLQNVQTAEDITSDHCIALALQHELNLEHDMELKGREKRMNQNSKLSINLSNHKFLPPIETDRPPMAWENIPYDDVTAYDHLRPLQAIHPSHNHGKKKKFTQKDRNVKSTHAGRFDEKTTRIIMSFINKGELREIGSEISTGKESYVHHAIGGSTLDGPLPDNVVVKIFKTKLNEFKNREGYIRDDHRFTNRLTKTNSIKNIVLWAEKEMRNMKRLTSAGVPCAIPYLYEGNVLVMSLIGKGLQPAPKLKDLNLYQYLWKEAYHKTVEIMENITQKCRLVHGDLSEYNLLYQDGEVFVIDFAQSVDLAHSSALRLLYRDCSNVSKFFHKKGVPDVLSGKTLFERISKLSLDDLFDDEGHQIEKIESEMDMWKGMNKSGGDPVYERLWDATKLRAHGTEDKEIDKAHASELCITGSVHKEDWIAKKTDSSVIVKNGGTPKKRRNRKNSANYNNKNIEEKPTEENGFMLITAEDCTDSNNSKPSYIKTSNSNTSSKNKNTASKRKPVRFSDTEYAADTEDYNGDDETDDPDTDCNLTDNNCDTTETNNDTEGCITDVDTEGYQGDADDTDY